MEHFFLEVLGRWSHVGLFTVLMAAGFGLPLPEDVPLVLAGLLVQQTTGDALQPLILMMCTGLVGVVVGDSCLFWIGRIYGQDVLAKKWIQRFAKPWLVEKAREKFQNHGAKILFVARFMPGLRAIMFLIAGTFKLPYWKLLAFDGSAAVISVPIWIWAGWYFPTKIQSIFSGSKNVMYVVSGLIVIAAVAWVVWEYRHNLRKGRKDEADALAASNAVSEPGKKLDETVASRASSPSGHLLQAGGAIGTKVTPARPTEGASAS